MEAMAKKQTDVVEAHHVNGNGRVISRPKTRTLARKVKSVPDDERVKSALIVKARTPQHADIEGEERRVDLRDPNLAAMGELYVTIKGTTPLLMNDPEIKMQKMLEQQMGAPKGKKPPKDPEQDFLEALVCIGKRPKNLKEAQSGKIQYGVPAVWWKSVAVRCGGLADFKMTELRSSLFVPATHGQNVALLDHSMPKVHIARVRVGNGNADVRVRAVFDEWSVMFKVIFNTRVLTPEQLVAFFVHGGQCNGVGEWRPARNGTYGCFEVSDAVAKTSNSALARS